MTCIILDPTVKLVNLNSQSGFFKIISYFIAECNRVFSPSCPVSYRHGRGEGCRW